jgi:hypothetical protein
MNIENAGARTGFSCLADRIAMNPEYEAFIFRKFDRLSARNLLQLESRLVYLEWKLDEADDQAARSRDNETLRSIRVWEAFEENAKDSTRLEHSRMRICNEIIEALKEYRKIYFSVWNILFANQNQRRSTIAPKSNSNS